jgi:hypothetical protein
MCLFVGFNTGRMGYQIEEYLSSATRGVGDSQPRCRLRMEGA